MGRGGKSIKGKVGAGSTHSRQGDDTAAARAAQNLVHEVNTVHGGQHNAKTPEQAMKILIAEQRYDQIREDRGCQVVRIGKSVSTVDAQGKVKMKVYGDIKEAESVFSLTAVSDDDLDRSQDLLRRYEQYADLVPESFDNPKGRRKMRAAALSHLKPKISKFQDGKVEEEVIREVAEAMYNAQLSGNNSDSEKFSDLAIERAGPYLLAAQSIMNKLGFDSKGEDWHEYISEAMVPGDPGYSDYDEGY